MGGGMGGRVGDGLTWYSNADGQDLKMKTIQM
jgi:hypothetical protein